MGGAAELQARGHGGGERPLGGVAAVQGEGMKVTKGSRGCAWGAGDRTIWVYLVRNRLAIHNPAKAPLLGGRGGILSFGSAFMVIWYLLLPRIKYLAAT